MTQMTVPELLAKGNSSEPAPREVAIRIKDGEVFLIGPQFPRTKPGFLILPCTKDGKPIIPERESEGLDKALAGAVSVSEAGGVSDTVTVSPLSTSLDMTASQPAGDPVEYMSELNIDRLMEASKEELVAIAEKHDVSVDNRLGPANMAIQLAAALGITK